MTAHLCFSYAFNATASVSFSRSAESVICSAEHGLISHCCLHASLPKPVRTLTLFYRKKMTYDFTSLIVSTKGIT